MRASAGLCLCAWFRGIGIIGGVDKARLVGGLKLRPKLHFIHVLADTQILPLAS